MRKIYMDHMKNKNNVRKKKQKQNNKQTNVKLIIKSPFY